MDLGLVVPGKRLLKIGGEGSHKYISTMCSVIAPWALFKNITSSFTTCVDKF